MTAQAQAEPSPTSALSAPSTQCYCVRWRIAYLAVLVCAVALFSAYAFTTFQAAIPPLLANISGGTVLAAAAAYIRPTWMHYIIKH